MTRKSLSLITLCLTLALVGAGRKSIQAQCVAEDAGIVKARYTEGASKIFVSLSSRVNRADLQATGQAAQWNLVDLSVSPSINVPIDDIAPTGLLGEETTSVTLSLSGPLGNDHVYMLAAPSLTFLGCKPRDGELPRVLIKVKKAPLPGTAGSAENKNYFPRGKAEDRNDSNVYLSGSIEGAREGKAQYSTDIKIEIPYEISANNNIVDVRPYFNLKTSTAEDADPDSMNFGGKFGLQFHTADSGPLRYLLWNPGAGFEADASFKNVNLLTTQMLTFGIPGNKRTFKRRVRILPFIGFELGRNVKSPVEEAEGQTISRGLIGGTFYANFDRTEDSGFSFQLDYTRRFLLRREVGFTEDDAKKFIPVTIGKGPRDYLKATAEYNFSKFTGIALSYEYGKLPPNFELVNHKYSLGLVLKFKTKFSTE